MQRCPQLQSKFEIHLSYMRHCLRKPKQEDINFHQTVGTYLLTYKTHLLCRHPDEKLEQLAGVGLAIHSVCFAPGKEQTTHLEVTPHRGAPPLLQPCRGAPACLDTCDEV